jgi:1-acyl-sn-glycerol-3-phosphate acyltransferase
VSAASPTHSATIDGFDEAQHEAFVGFDARAADRTFRVIDRIARALHVEIVGLENIPRGRALLVANHAFGWDVGFLMARVWRERREPLWALGEHLWWRIPFLRRVAVSAGTVDGTPENVDRLLAHDQLVIVLPGGLREAVKPRALRYRLLWGHRYGFVRAAIQHRAPVVPVASIGTDELFDFVGDAYLRGQRWTGGRLPIPLPAGILPIPHRRSLKLVVGTPIDPPAEPAGEAERAVVERRFRHEIAGAIHELIETELARREGVSLGGD